MSAPRLFAVMGPTASGKSHLAEEIASLLDAPILNADAFQIYRGMDIGTAKPNDRERYHLLDLKNPNEDFGVGEFVILAADLLRHFLDQGRDVVICGGTGLYVRALLEEYKDLMPAPSEALRREIGSLSLDEALERLQKADPDEADRIDAKNEIRVKRALEKLTGGQTPIQFSLPPFLTTKIAIIPPVEISRTKIMQRTKEMIQNGWVAEVNELISQGYGPGDPGFRALGYEAIAQYVQEGGDELELVQKIELDTVKYAKRQRTWLRAEPNLTVFNEASEALDAVERQVRGGYYEG
ncbi:MAG: tRNA (adenosine(37)-N6)-dimethylallyltransferase MiaA [Armatimonadetes bacterium]|nr:tRNA (adenosine(37)-N6)-dimethylallyltransferase MiaA [Armatimonadota bacterium]